MFTVCYGAPIVWVGVVYFGSLNPKLFGDPALPIYPVNDSSHKFNGDVVCISSKRIKIIKIFPLFIILLFNILPFVSAQTNVNFGLVAYGISFSSGDIAEIAERFDFVDMEFGHSSDVGLLHFYNPDLTVLGYKDAVYAKSTMSDWSTISANPEWFYKNGSDYAYNSYWGTYLMNISNVGWQQHIIDFIIANVDGKYNGVFLDDVWDDVADYEASLNVTLLSDFKTNWHSDMLTFLTHIQTDYSGFVMINSDEMETDTYLAQAEGQMIEGYIHPDWNTYDEWEAFYLTLGDDLARKTALNKYIWAHSGVIHSTSVNDESVLDSSWGNFYGNVSSSEEYGIFSFNTWSSSDLNRGWWEPPMFTTEYATPTPEGYNYKTDPSYFKLMPLAVIGILIGLFAYVVLLVGKR